MCGGTTEEMLSISAPRGLSPRMRGHLKGLAEQLYPSRSIPADAGAPPGLFQDGRPAKVYPRGCGGTTDGALVPVVGHGLSPRMRGHHGWRACASSRPRSIPADAGAPLAALGRSPASRVYPRGCGGTRKVPMHPLLNVGLSPRMRGHRPLKIGALAPMRSIPADAGAPKWESRRA